ncbi:MAG: hypothetical protein K6B45_11430 [Bacteroidaceae bacterium]|nr:hypothetical protein [Bacteroidaceae bacterium]
MKKVFVAFLFLTLLTGCRNSTINGSIESSSEYDFEALRDSLGLDSTCIFVKECSPLYKDNNPYDFDEETRIKTLFYTVFPPDEECEYFDTVVYAVRRDNSIIFWGRNDVASSAKRLIDWTINNREKI